MKKILALMAVATAFIFTSCSEENENSPKELEGKNTVVLEFDNGIAGKAIKIGETSYTTTSKDKITITALDYIVGNFELTNEAGETTKIDGFYIISEGGELGNGKEKVAISKVELPSIPAGKYTKIKFGIGVDKKTFEAQTEKFNTDGNADGIDLWTQAKKYGLVWMWTSGYKFTQFEGTYTSATQPTEQGFQVHIASKGETDLYKEVELDITDTAIVSSEVSPQLHIMVDASKILDGNSKINLSENNSIMGGQSAKKIAENTTEMFMVHHVHNGNHHD